jgi:predicted enzyme related to lactoylglutathione lyase
VGLVSSADIAVPDHARVSKFYARVLTTGARPLWREDLMNVRGIPVIGLGARTPELADLPLQWMPHIQVADVAESTRRALSMGGRELMHGKDATGASQWAVLLDPDGAAFGLIPRVASASIGPARDETTHPPAGRIARLELTVPDAAASRDFYRHVVGWTAREIEVADGTRAPTDFTLLTPHGTAVAAVRQARAADHGLPAVWLMFLPVGDLAASLDRVREEGGGVLRTRHDPAHEDEYAVIRDPVGAHLALQPA